MPLFHQKVAKDQNDSEGSLRWGKELITHVAYCHVVFSVENKWLGLFRKEKLMEFGGLCQVKPLEVLVSTSTVSPG